VSVDREAHVVVGVDREVTDRWPPSNKEVDGDLERYVAHLSICETRGWSSTRFFERSVEGK